jgi:hypothetical protein
VCVCMFDVDGKLNRAGWSMQMFFWTEGGEEEWGEIEMDMGRNKRQPSHTSEAF